jgi:acetylglutamate kinase
VTTVVKIGGRVQDDARLAPALVAAQRAAAGGLVVVHGGGDDISALQRRLGHEPRFVGGRRATSDEELEIVRMVLSGSANKRLVASLVTAGCRTVGISGEDGGLLLAHVAPGAPLGRVGGQVHANPLLLRDLLSAGWLPVVSPLARDGDDPQGTGLNVNGDDAAAAIAIALGAGELLFLADVPGVLVEGVAAPSLTREDATRLVAAGTAVGGMAAKLEAGFVALARGVARVRIAGLAGLRDDSSGTTLLPPTVAEWHP